MFFLVKFTYLEQQGTVGSEGGGGVRPFWGQIFLLATVA